MPLLLASPRSRPAFGRAGAARLLPCLLALALPHRAAPAENPPPATSTTEERWSIATVVEPESVEEVPAAVVRARGGFVLAVAREPGGERVIGVVRLPPADQDFLDDARSVELQVDDQPGLEPRRLGGGLKSSTFFLWDGVGEPALGPLRDLMEARERIVVRYPLAGGGHKEIAFPATGAKAAIAQVLGVAEDTAPAAHELALARQEAVERCLSADKPKERDRCLEGLAGCAEAATADALRACLGAGRVKRLLQ